MHHKFLKKKIMNDKLFLCGISLDELAFAIRNILMEPVANNTSSDENLLSREQACKLLDINKTTLWKHTKNGKLKSYGIGNRVFYKKHELLESVRPLNH